MRGLIYMFRMKADYEIWGEWGTANGSEPQDAPAFRGCPCGFCTTYWRVFDACKLRMPTQQHCEGQKP